MNCHGLTGQLEKEETALRQFLALNSQLFGVKNRDHIKGVAILAQNYCRQQKREKFDQLARAHQLDYICPWR